MKIDGKKTATGLIMIAISWIMNKSGVVVEDPDVFTERATNALTVVFEIGGYALTAFGAWHKNYKLKRLEARKLPG